MPEVVIVNTLPDWNASGFDVPGWNAIFKNHNVIINSEVYEAEYPEHWGPLSLKFAFKGCEYYETENCRYMVKEGNFLLMNENQMYSSSIISQRAVRTFTINFCPEFKKKKFSDLLTGEGKMLDDPCYEPGTDVNFFSKLYPYDSHITAEVLELKMYLDRLNYNTLFINEKLSNILEAIYRVNCSVLNETAVIHAGKPSTRIETYRRLTRAKDYMNSNFQSEVSLEVLAVVSCMNPFHFLRKFKQFYGKTPHQYLTEIRLREAKSLLKDKNRNVTDVCLSVGFEDLSSFSRLFKKHFNATPGVYRKSL